jgi:hypothetical protein
MKLAMLFFLLVPISAGCTASGPKYAAIADRIPPVPENSGRIYFFRSSSFVGSGIHPDVRLNDVVVGESIPGGFFFVDRAPGDYVVATSTEAEHKLMFHLDAQQTRYVETLMQMGLFVGQVHPELVDTSVGELNIRESTYTGPELAAPTPRP